jgi:hypothetical protein
VGDRRTRGVPERWLLPPPPSDPHLAARWESSTFERRRILARVDASALATLPHGDREVVGGLARRRIMTRWRLYAASLGLGWLVLMAVWGFGRSTFPTDATAWLQAGLALGAIVAAVALLATRRRLLRARRIRDATERDAHRGEA